jgi:hypothetical protein
MPAILSQWLQVMTIIFLIVSYERFATKGCDISGTPSEFLVSVGTIRDRNANNDSVSCLQKILYYVSIVKLERKPPSISAGGFGPGLPTQVG